MWAYDKETNKTFLTHVDNVASERYFYDIPIDEIYLKLSLDEQEQIKLLMKEANLSSIQELNELGRKSLEKFFNTKVEGNFKKLLDKIRSSYNLMPDPLFSKAIREEDKFELFLMLSFQIVRSKEFRESYFESYESIMQAIVDMIAFIKFEDYELGSIKVEPHFEYKKLEHAKLIMEGFPFELGKLLNAHIWIVGVNHTNMPFYYFG